MFVPEGLKYKKKKFGYIFSLEDILHLDKLTKKQFILRNLVYESNKIEGIDLNPDEFPDAPEIKDHYRAYKYILSNLTKCIVGWDWKDGHRILSQDLNIELPGKYRQRNIWIGGKVVDFNERKWTRKINVADYHFIIPLLSELQKRINDMERGVKESELWARHSEFEGIHPHMDGNGRAGRIGLVQMYAVFRNEMPVILNEKRPDYIKILEDYRRKNMVWKEPWNIQPPLYIRDDRIEFSEDDVPKKLVKAFN